MLDYNIFLHAKPGFCWYMHHFNVFVTGPVTTGLDRFFLLFFAVFCGPGPWSLISEAFWDRSGLWFEPKTGTGPDLEALLKYHLNTSATTLMRPNDALRLFLFLFLTN